MAIIQGIGQQTAASATNVLAFTSAVTAGSLLVLGSSNNGAGPVVSTVTDSQGNTWARATGITHQFNTKDTELWYVASAVAGTTTVTVTYSSSCDSGIVLGEYPGVASSPLDQVAAGKSPDGSPSTALDSGATPATTQASELLIGVGADDNGIGAQTYTAGTGWTKDVTLVGSKIAMALESQSVTATGTYDATFTLGTSDQWACLIATFKAAGAATFGRVIGGTLAGGLLVGGLLSSAGGR